MTPFLRSMFVVARRDLISIVATPTFLLFLFAPLFMLAVGALGGMGASQLADSARGAGRIVAVIDASDIEAARDADARLRTAFGRPPATLELRVAGPVPADPVAIAREKGSDTYAVLSGPLATPRIVEREPDSSAGRYLALLASEVLRTRTTGAAPPITPRFENLASGGTSIAAQQSMGFAAVFAIFLLTLLLAGQTVGSLAEEKGNKVIEILAAAVPLESVFLGKLLGMLGVAILFVMNEARRVEGLTARRHGADVAAIAGLVAERPHHDRWMISLRHYMSLDTFNIGVFPARIVGDTTQIADVGETVTFQIGFRHHE